MVYSKDLGQSPSMGSTQRDGKETPAIMQFERLRAAIFNISSAIIAHEDLNKILEVIARESLNCLEANRSTIFLTDPQTGNLKPQCIQALDPLDERVGLFEEGEVAQKAFELKKPFVVGGRGKSPDLSEGQKHERQIISLMSFPLSPKGETVGVVSLVLVNEGNGFDEKNIQFFSSFANLASIAMEISNFPEGAHKGKSIGIPKESAPNNIPDPPTSFLPKENQRSGEPIVEKKAEQRVEEPKVIGGPNKEKIAWAPGVISIKGEWLIDRRKDERVETIVRVEFREEYWAFAENLSNGGAFIVTSAPLDTGDEMVLKLHLPDGREELDLDCQVVWNNQYGDETRNLRPGMGVKFINLKPEEQRRILAYIEFQKNLNLRLKK